MTKEKKDQLGKQTHRAGKRITTSILKNIKNGQDNPELAWPGCPRFFPPVGATEYQSNIEKR